MTDSFKKFEKEYHHIWDDMFHVIDFHNSDDSNKIEIGLELYGEPVYSAEDALNILYNQEDYEYDAKNAFIDVYLGSKDCNVSDRSMFNELKRIYNVVKLESTEDYGEYCYRVDDIQDFKMLYSEIQASEKKLKDYN